MEGGVTRSLNSVEAKDTQKSMETTALSNSRPKSSNYLSMTGTRTFIHSGLARLA